MEIPGRFRCYPAADLGDLLELSNASGITGFLREACSLIGVLQNETRGCFEGDYRCVEEVYSRLILGDLRIEFIEPLPSLLLDPPESQSHELLGAIGDVGRAGSLHDPRGLGLDPLPVGEV